MGSLNFLLIWFKGPTPKDVQKRFAEFEEFANLKPVSWFHLDKVECIEL